MEKKEDIGRMHTAGLTIDFEYGELWRGLHRSNPLSFKKPFSFIVYKDRDKYMAEDWRGRIRFEDDDASEVIQSAVNSLPEYGGVIFVRAGEYLFYGKITLKSRVFIIGEGCEKTVFKNMTDQDRMIEVRSDTGGGIRHVGLKGITLHGNRDCYTISEVVIFAENFMHLDLDVEILGSSNKGLRIEGDPWCSLFRSNYLNIHDNGGRGLEIYGTVNCVHISRCYLRYNGAEPLVIGDITGTDHSPWQIQIDHLLTENNSKVSSIGGSNTRMKIGFWWGDNDVGIYIPSTGEIEIDFLYYGGDTAGSLVNIDHASKISGKIWNLYNPSGNALRIVDAYVKLDALIVSAGTLALGGAGKLICPYGDFITVNSGVATFSGDGSTTEFKIEHGLAKAPSKYVVSPLTPDAHADKTISADDTYIIITFSTAPPSGTDNLKFSWWAEV